MRSCCHGNIHYTYHLILSELFAPLIVIHVRSNLTYCKNMQNLENLDVFEISITQKTAKMPEGPFCQIRTQMEAEFHFRFCFEGWIWVLIASVPDLCIRFTFLIKTSAFCSIEVYIRLVETDGN